MTKYIKNYGSLEAATGDTTVVSPNVTYVSNGTVSKLIMKDVGDNVELQIKGDSIAALTIDVKQVGPEYVD